MPYSGRSGYSRKGHQKEPLLSEDRLEQHETDCWRWSPARTEASYITSVLDLMCRQGRPRTVVMMKRDGDCAELLAESLEHPTCVTRSSGHGITWD